VANISFHSDCVVCNTWCDCIICGCLFCCLLAEYIGDRCTNTNALSHPWQPSYFCNMYVVFCLVIIYLLYCSSAFICCYLF